MAFDRSEFEALIADRKRQFVADKHLQLEQMTQAKPPMKVLTQSAEWDVFLQILQALVDRAKDDIRDAQDKMLTTLVTSAEDQFGQQVYLHRLKMRSDTLEEVMAIPRKLIEGSEKAEEILKEYGSDNGGG